MCLRYAVDVLVFDGMMIRKCADIPIIEEVLDKLSGCEFDKTGSNIKFVEKELDTTMNCDDYEDIGEIKIVNSITYPKDKEEFEKPSLRLSIYLIRVI